MTGHDDVNTHQVYTLPERVSATENCDPHSTFITPRPASDSIFIGIWKKIFNSINVELKCITSVLGISLIVRFEILVAVLLSFQAFWHIIPY